MQGNDIKTLPEAWRTELAQGLQCLRSGDLDRAEAHFVRAHERAPEQPEVLYALGRERLRQGRHAEAEALLVGAWTKDSSLAGAAAALARSLATHEPAKAHEILREALEVHPVEPGLKVVEGEVFLEEQRTEEARACFEAALGFLEDAGRDAPATRGAIAAGHGARAQHRGHRARPRGSRRRGALRLQARHRPGSRVGRAHGQHGRGLRAPGPHRSRALLLRARSRPQSRERHGPPASGAAPARPRRSRARRADLPRAPALDPDHTAARTGLAEVLLMRGDAESATVLLEEAAARDPEDADARYQLGVAFETLGDLARAEKQYRRALALDEEHVPASCKLATVLMRQGDYVEAPGASCAAPASSTPCGPR